MWWVRVHERWNLDDSEALICAPKCRRGSISPYSHLYWYPLVSNIYIEYCLFFFFTFWLCCVTYGLLVPWPGMEPKPSALEVQNLNRWTTGDISRKLNTLILILLLFFYFWNHSPSPLTHRWVHTILCITYCYWITENLEIKAHVSFHYLSSLK